MFGFLGKSDKRFNNIYFRKIYLCIAGCMYFISRHHHCKNGHGPISLNNLFYASTLVLQTLLLMSLLRPKLELLKYARQIRLKRFTELRFYSRMKISSNFSQIPSSSKSTNISPSSYHILPHTHTSSSDGANLNLY